MEEKNIKAIGKELRNDLSIILNNESRKETFSYKLLKDYHERDSVHKISDFEDFAQLLLYFKNELLYKGDAVFECENFELVKSLYLKSKSEEEKDIILRYLRWNMTLSNKIPGISGFAFFCYAKIINIREAAEFCLKNFRVKNIYMRVLIYLAEFIKYEHNQIDKDDADFLNQNIRSSFKDLEKDDDIEVYYKMEALVEILTYQTNEIQHIRLKDRVYRNINWEVNQDKEKVQEYISKFGFDPELSKILDKIDSEFVKGPDEFDFKSCITHARTFQEHIINETVSEIVKRKNITFNGRSFTSRIDYLKRNDIRFVSEKEYDFIKSLYDFASVEGTHRLSADYAGARIIKNIVIELALFVLERLENYN